MAIPSIVQYTSGTFSGTTFNASFSNKISAGSAVMLLCGQSGTLRTQNAPTDDLGTTYSSYTGNTNGTSLTHLGYIGKNLTGNNPTLTQTFTGGSVAVGVYILVEISGLNNITTAAGGGANPNTDVGSSFTATTLVTTSGSAIPASHRNLILGHAISDSGFSFTAFSGYILVVSVANGTTNMALVYRYNTTLTNIGGGGQFMTASGSSTGISALKSIATVPTVSNNNFLSIRGADGISVGERIR